jgi:hypothetical protein
MEHRTFNLSLSIMSREESSDASIVTTHLLIVRLPRMGLSRNL